METLVLNSGDRMPVVGLGLWKVDCDHAASLVQTAIGSGYRHLDSACDYGNEVEVGQGIRAALDEGLCTREDLWITSKLWNTYHRPEHVRPALARSMEDLGVDYLDLYLVHFPIALEFVPFQERYPPEWLFDPDSDEPAMRPAPVPLFETWRAMEELLRDGKVRNIGVCNYSTGLMQDLLNYAETPPAVLQIELHPYLTQPRMLRLCQEAEVAVTGFSPLGASSYVPLSMATRNESVLNEPVVHRAADHHGRSPAQIVLRWAVQRGTAVIPKTSRSERLTENLSLFDFELDADEMEAISGLNRHRRFNDPGRFTDEAFGCFFPIFD